MTIGLQLLSELRAEESVVLLREVAQSILNSSDKLLLIQHHRSLGSVREVRVQRLPGDDIQTKRPYSSGSGSRGIPLARILRSTDILVFHKAILE